MYFFTSDEHYYHKNIIKYCKRPFTSIEHMNETLINNHNSVVSKKDIVIHAGDFTLIKENKRIFDVEKRLNGTHIFLKGSHDYWLKDLKNIDVIWEKYINNTYVVVCHYSMRVWPRSHYGSIMLYGHSHGMITPLKNQWDIGVDNNDFYPQSLDQVKEKIKMNKRIKNDQYKRRH